MALKRRYPCEIVHLRERVESEQSALELEMEGLVAISRRVQRTLDPQGALLNQQMPPMHLHQREVESS